MNTLLQRGSGTGSARRAGITANMRERASRLGCYLGLLREGKLEWKDLQDCLPGTARGVGLGG